MKMSVPSTIVLVILLVAGLYVMPMYFVSIVQWRNDYENMYTYARELTDQIIDTRQFTETMEEDFNLAIASANNTFIGKVTREVKMVNPDPSNPGETYTSYMVIEQNREYKQGDFVTVTIEPAGSGILQTISSKLLGLNYYSGTIRYCARVR